MYYNDDSIEDTLGMYTWEDFINNEVSYDGSDLYIGDACFVASSAAEKLGDWLINFHDQVYDYWFEEEEE